MLRTVLQGLVNRAATAMPEGGLLQLGTSVIQHPTPHDRMAVPRAYAVLDVHDTGRAMAEADQRRLTGPVPEPAGAGTAHPLDALHALLQQGDGFITCGTGPELGTRVRVHVPLAGAPPI